MKKKYVACIMTKHDLGNNNYVFSTSHIVTGFKNDKDEFIDRNGNTFYSIISSQVINLSIPTGYSNCIEIEELKKQLDMSNHKTEEVLKKYSIICSKTIYYVGKTSDGKYFINESNIDEIQKEVDRIKETGEENARVVPLEDLVDYLTNNDLPIEKLFELRNYLLDKFTDIDKALYVLDSLIVAKDNKKPLEEVTKEDIIAFRSLDTLQIPKVPEPITLVEGQNNDDDVKVIEDLIVGTPEEEMEDTLRYQKLMGQDKINIEDIYNKVTRSLVAQDEPTRHVITEIARKEMDARKKKTAILLTGDTGVGKTYMMELIARHLNRPFITVNTSSITIPGYVGKDIEEVIWDIYEACDKDKSKAEHAIVFFDEIDKKGSKEKSDVSGQGVLNVLLKFIEGTTYTAKKDSKRAQESIDISTNNMTVIFGGAFTDVYKELQQDNSIGFSGEISSKDQPRKATVNDFVEKAMMTYEFMGRVDVIHLNDLSVEDIKKVFNADESAPIIQKKIFEKLGVKLTFTDDYIQEVSEKAHNQGTGARGLSEIIDNDTWEAFADAHSHPGEYSEIIIDENTAQDNHQYQKIKSIKTKKPTTSN